MKNNNKALETFVLHNLLGEKISIEELWKERKL